MAAVLAVRRAAARLDTRARLVVAAIAWIITRVPMYLLDDGIVHLRWQARLVGDILIYQQWLPFFAHGRFPAADPRWQYPPGAAAVLSVPHLLPGSFASSFFVVELLCDLVITAVLARMAIRHGSWLGCWCWLAGIPLLGPVVFGHFDIAATLLAVVALYLADSPWGLGAFAGLGAVVKVWPLAVLVGARPGQASKAVLAAVAAAGVIVGGYLTFTHGSLSFLANQNSRGIEIESVAAQPFLVLRMLGMWHGDIAYQYGSFQVAGPGVGITATVMLASTVLALIFLAWWRWRMSWRPEAVGDAALVATLLLVTTSRVISVQYMIWLIGMAACALVFPRTSQRPVALLLMIAAGLTLLEWMLLLKIVGGAGIVGIGGIAVLALRDVLLLAAAVLGAARLWRSTCRPHGSTGTRGAHARTRTAAAPRAGLGSAR